MNKHIPKLRLSVLLFLGVFLFCQIICAEEKLNLINSGFEDGSSSWSLDKEMSKIIPEAARNGKFGLRVSDKSSTEGSSASSAFVPATQGKTYTLRFWGRSLEGGVLGVYLVFFDAQNKSLNDSARKNENITHVKGADWKEYTVTAIAPEGTASAKVWIHSFVSVQVVADVDDLVLVAP